MASLNLVAKRKRSSVFQHPILSLVGLSLCAAVFTFTLQLIVSYQPILSNARAIIQDQSQQLTQRNEKQRTYAARKRAHAQRENFLHKQQLESKEIDAFAALLKHLHTEFGETAVKLNKNRLEITASYKSVDQTESLKTWLISNWKNPNLETEFDKQLLPKHSVLLTMQRPSQ